MSLRSALLLIFIFAFGHSIAGAELDKLTVEDFFRSDAISSAALSPDGELVAYLRSRSIMVGNSQFGYQSLASVNGKFGVNQLQWSGPRQITVSSSESSTVLPVFSVLDLAEIDGALVLDNRIDFSRGGYVLDFVPDDPEQLLLVLQRSGKNGVKSNIYRINPYESLTHQTGQFSRINGSFDQAGFFLLNSKNQPLIGMGYVDGRPVLYRQNLARKKWKKIWKGDTDIVFRPMSISSDNRTLYVLTNALTDRIAVVEFDLKKAKLKQIVYLHDSVDVTAIVSDPQSGAVLAAQHLQGGLAQYEFLDASEQASFEWIKQKLGDQSVHIAQRTVDREVYLVFSTSGLKPAIYYLCSKRTDQCDKVASTMPRLSDVELSPTVEFFTESTDNLQVQSFLTMPTAGSDQVPLIVMPHGGPIGVQSNRQFNGNVQWLAHNGYAVLQVNYRGSGGFGKKFQGAGLGEWGRGIEDDIERSLEKALQDNPRLNSQRVGIFGSSYGGYSALFSVIRSPDRYRCAASYAGVTDLTLLFSPRYIRKNKFARERLTEMIGDPKVEKEVLIANSPVYNYKEVSRPVFLAHGSDDNRVDVEHSWRLNQLLERAESPVELHILDGVGHSFRYTSEIKELYDPLMKFLDKHLKQ